MAAHFVASGYSDWGVSWGTTLRWVDKGIKCPFNASAFNGLRFKAKGNGRVRVHLGVPETVPTDQEGRCKERCWDTHSRIVMLSDEWETYVIPWEQLQQWGWGTEAPFTPEQVLSLQFAVDSKDLPVDFWIDDVEFTRASETTNAGSAAPATTAPATTAPATTTGPTTAPATTAAPTATTASPAT